MQSPQVADTELTITFRPSNQRPIAESDYIEFRQQGFPIVWLRLDGTAAIIEVGDVGDANIGRELRRVVPFAAALQGKLTLHAAGLCSDDETYCIIGESGTGKSTFSDALMSTHKKVADDLLPCRNSGGKIAVLTPDDQLKRLRSCYFLSRGSSRCKIESMDSTSFMSALLRNGFGELPSTEIWQLQFSNYARMVEQCEGYELRIPDDLGRLSESVDMFIARFAVPAERRRGS